MRRLIETLEWLFRHVVVYPVLRILFHNPYSEKRIELSSVKKILILRFDRIGDMIVTTPIFKALKQRHPGIHIGVFTSSANAEIVRNNQNVDAVYVLDLNWWALLKEIMRARKAHYDVVLNFIFNRTTSAGILANLVAPKGHKVGQGAEKYKFYFNRLLRLERTEKHMVEVLAYFVEQVFGITLTPAELQFEIAIDTQSREHVDAYLSAHELARKHAPGKRQTGYIVLNVSATDAVRKISREQVSALTHHLVANTSVVVMLIGAPSDQELLVNIKRETNSNRCLAYPENGMAPLLQIASLIEGALCVLTPDTSIIHFASATKTPVMGFFTPLQMTHEWVPFNVHHVAVYAPTGKPTSELPIPEMTSQVDRFLASLNTEEKDSER